MHWFLPTSIQVSFFKMVKIETRLINYSVYLIKVHLVNKGHKVTLHCQCWSFIVLQRCSVLAWSVVSRLESRSFVFCPWINVKVIHQFSILNLFKETNFVAVDLLLVACITFFLKMFESNRLIITWSGRF